MIHKKYSGFVNLIVLVGMLIVAISLPVATKLVQQNQENRSDAASNCYCKGAKGTITAQYPCQLAKGTWTCPSAKCTGGNGQRRCIPQGGTGYIYSCVNGAWTNASSCGSNVPCASDGVICGKIETVIEPVCVYKDGDKCFGGIVHACNKNGQWQEFIHCSSGLCNEEKTDCGTAPEPTTIYGICDDENENGCKSGTFSDVADDAEFFIWDCIGESTNVHKRCWLHKPIIDANTTGSVNGVCLTKKDKCFKGQYNDLIDTDGHFLWQCLGINGGKNDDCDLLDPDFVFTPPQKINGDCGPNIILDYCYKGDIHWIENNDIKNIYRWECVGFNGGTNDTCVIAQNPTPTLTLTVEEDTDFNKDSATNGIDFSQWKGFLMINDLRGDLNHDGSVNTIDGSIMKNAITNG